MERKMVKRKIFGGDDGEELMYLHEDCECIAGGYQEDCCGSNAGVITGNAEVDICIKSFSRDLSECQTHEDVISAIEVFKRTLPSNIEPKINVDVHSLIDSLDITLQEIRPETDKEAEARKKRELKNIEKKKKQLKKLKEEVARLEGSI